MRTRFIVAVLAAALVVSTGCKKKEPNEAGSGQSQGTAPTAADAPSAKAGANADGTVKQPNLVTKPGATVAVLEGYKPKKFQVPVGPPLGIFPGQGVGAIRFGATVDTVERLMVAKCTEKTKEVCRYVGHAVDFRFGPDGGVREIRIHGDERRFSDKPNDTYGVFNGRFAEGAALGMYPAYVVKDIGEPKSRAVVPEAEQQKAPFPTVERHYYDNMVLEYDKLENGNVVLAGVILTPPDKKK